ncbi:MAG: acylphosphatase [Deltaproteobacteria bacterium CG11_big_fil_rev_8_21_14_0_20_47_16]|nr:MAG: acylphosphatase [Deltaproteobacteria bacterium CG11_big_fil_rev_8_21_14_0_20_47_16]
MSQLHCIIRGRVQGVFFRAATQEKAEELGLMGWVRNQPDGSVECVAQGSQETLQQLLQWLHKGPPAAKVTQVESEWQSESSTLSNFRII